MGKILKAGFVILLLQGLVGQVMAQALNDYALQNSSETAGDGGALELGIGFGADSVPMYLGGHDDELDVIGRLVASYQWRGAFFEFDNDKSDNIPIGSETVILGFNAYNSQNLALDLIVGPEHSKRYSNSDEQYAGIKERKGDATGGVRATLYMGDYIGQFIARTDLSGRHDGSSASILVGRNWQLSRFNFHSNFKLGFASQKMADFYLGVSADEANSTFNEYHVNDAYYSAIQLGLAYPFTKEWVLRFNTSVAYVSDELANSPLLASDSIVRNSTEFTVNYVF